MTTSSASGRPVAAGPVAGDERIASLDVLRGVAVLGILVMNIYAFAMPFPAYTNPYVMGGTDPLNLGVWIVTHVLFDQKFMTIFSMLFGAGIVLMAERATARGRAFGGMFFRRQIWLLLIGALHAYLIWFGDILFFYALIGMLAFLFRKRSPRTLIVTACVLLCVPPLINYASSFYMENLMSDAAAIEARADTGVDLSAEEQATLDEWRASRAFFAPTEEDVQADLEAYRSDYATIVEHRVPFVLMMHLQATPFFMLWRIGGLMLLGMALMKLRVFTAERSTVFYRRLLLVGYAFGLPLTLLSAWLMFANEFDPIFVMRVGMVPNYVGSVLVALGHVAAVMLVVRLGLWSGAASRFAAVGRTALSNYLMHSLVMTTIFYGYALGLYGDVPRVGQQALVAALIGVQLLLAPWWLSRFRFGPFEWLWRSLAYGRRQPLLRH